jgi:diguanylate cyclase (GGDEF)-like protein/PAS domain S-box-containing protein
MHGAGENADGVQRLAQAVEAGRVGRWALDRRTSDVVWDATLCDILGVDTPHRSSLATWLDLVHPEDRDRVAAVLTAPDGSVDACFRVTGAAEGRQVLVRGREAETGSTSLVGPMVDITACARPYGHELADALEVITDAYYALDDAWRFTYVNAEAERLLGASRERLLGRELWDEFPSDPAFDEAYRRVAATREPEVFESYYAPLGLWSEVRVYPLPTTGLAVYFRDIGQRRRQEQERERLLKAEQTARQQAQRAQRTLAHQATHDALTGLANRRLVADLLAEATRKGIVLFLDVDRFKHINDSLGHGIGDALLVAVAARLRAAVRPGDTVARMGGDEFVVLLPGADLDLGQHIADRILQRLRVPFDIVEHRLYATASVGIAPIAAGGDPDQILRTADVALYRAKDAGRDRSALYDEEAHQQVAARLRLEVELRQAVEAGDFVLHHQPAFDLRTGQVQGVEALVRWRHAERGLVAPGAFIGLAEDTGLIEPLGAWCISSAFRTVRRWIDRDLDWVGWVNLWCANSPAPASPTGCWRNSTSSGCHPRGSGWR